MTDIHTVYLYIYWYHIECHMNFVYKHQKFYVSYCIGISTEVVGKVYRLLMEIESRALPMGLHQVGVPPSAEESIATLVNIAQLDRPATWRLWTTSSLCQLVAIDV